MCYAADMSNKDGDVTISAGTTVQLKYTMYGKGGKQLATTGDDSETYVHGTTVICPGLKRALEGRRAGDSFEIRLEPEDAFGPKRRGVGEQPIPRSTFPEDAELAIGMRFDAEAPTGGVVELFITRIEPSRVFVDTNHPYAGMPVRYSVEVLSVEPAG